jgi:hypothetical protein
VALHPVELPDGSGTMQLPAGWRITGANKGMVDAIGPQGAVDLGIWTPVFTPQAAAQMYMRPPLVIPYGDPAVAAQAMTAVLNASPGHTGSIRWLRLIEKKPTPWPNGVGAFLHYEWLYNGVRCQSVALILESPNVDGTFTYYSSSVTAPSAKFAKSLPVLLQVWSHWKVADHVFQERLANAMASMRETNRILHDANAYRQEVVSRGSHAADLNVRGHWMIEDTETGAQREVDNTDIDKHVEALNKRAGYERYRVAPYHKISP